MTPDGAFLGENSFAEYAMRAMDRAADCIEGSPAMNYWLAIAQTRAILALAFEQRQTRFDLSAVLRPAERKDGSGI